MLYRDEHSYTIERQQNAACSSASIVDVMAVLSLSLSLSLGLKDHILLSHAPIRAYIRLFLQSCKEGQVIYAPIFTEKLSD